MKLKYLKTLTLTCVVAGVIAACAEYPTDRGNENTVVSANDAGGEMADKNQVTGVGIDSMAMYNSQEAEMAIADAETAMAKAEEAAGLWSYNDKMLSDAKEALAAGDINTAVELAIAAEQQAKMSYNQYQLEQANYMVNSVKAAHPDLSPDMLEKIAEAENAYLDDKGAQALEVATALMMEAGMVSGHLASREHNKEKMADMGNKARAKEMVASNRPVALGDEVHNGVDQYEVERGDSLWGISAKPVVYDNPYEWPLIYKANKDKIKDPDLIHPGQNLEIDRKATPAQVEAAINHAKHRGAWVLGAVEASDQNYLNQASQSGVASR